MSSKNVFLCFYGITRSLSFTVDSIKRNIINQLPPDVTIGGHFFNQKTINNVRSGEHGALIQDEWKLLPFDWIELSDPLEFQSNELFSQISDYGDTWEDGYASLKNLMHQLYSLKMVTNWCLEHGAEIVVFARPDLLYHNSIHETFSRAFIEEKATTFLPLWQPHNGVNDRFSICVSRSAIIAYGKRYCRMLEFCRALETSLDSEQLLKYSLENSEIRLRSAAIKASRVRLDGTIKEESFSLSRTARIKFLLEWLTYRI